MERRLPEGENTLPIILYQERYLTSDELPGKVALEAGKIPDALLVERVVQRVAQGREQTIYGFDMEHPEVSPEDQIAAMKDPDSELGKMLIAAERLLVHEEISILGVERG